jgi:hypothetical protein
MIAPKHRFLRLAYIGLMAFYFVNNVRAAHATNKGNAYENRFYYCLNNVVMLLATIAWSELEKEGVVEDK